MKIEGVPISFFLRQHSVLIQGVVLGVISVMLFTSVSLGLFGRAREMQASLVQKRSELAGLSQEIVFLTNLDQEVLRSRVTILNAALPPTKDVLIYLNTIDGLSRELGLSLKGIQLSPGELASGSAENTKVERTKVAQSEGAGMHSLDTQLTITGTQESIYAFLRAIEQTAPLMRVKDVKVSRVGTDNFNLSVMLAMLYADRSVVGGLKGKTVLFSSEEEELLKQLVSLKSYGSVAGQNITVPSGKSNLFEVDQGLNSELDSQ